MISRVTLYSLLLCLLLGAWIWRWSATHKDNCDLYLAGDTRLPSSEIVVTGTRQIVVPCHEWLLRQPEWLQILCLVDLVFGGIFTMNALQDGLKTFEERQRRRTAENDG